MRKRVCIISAALCMALAVTACGGRKDVSYDSGPDAAEQTARIRTMPELLRAAGCSPSSLGYRGVPR